MYFIMECINSRDSTLMTSGDLRFDLSEKHRKEFQLDSVDTSNAFYCVFLSLLVSEFDWEVFLAPLLLTMTKLGQTPTWSRVKKLFWIADVS